MKKLIAGLGNPGDEYRMMRHNVGSRIVAAFAEGRDLPPDVKILLPTTPMNESGKAIRPLMVKNGIEPKRLLVVHDDADISFGKFKLSFGSRSAGHRGVESVIQALGTKDFWRLRIGIQPVPTAASGPAPRHVRADELVLKPFTPQEEAELPRIIEAAIGAIQAWVEKAQ
jgi:PTH1 family peptidyl-tRNA hydrolase